MVSRPYVQWQEQIIRLSFDVHLLTLTFVITTRKLHKFFNGTMEKNIYQGKEIKVCTFFKTENCAIKGNNPSASLQTTSNLHFTSCT